jgi:rod shape-determining protein MreD
VNPRWLAAPLTIALSIMVALILTIAPLPSWAEMLRPAWVSLVVFYWVLALPERFNVGWAWLTGLLVDALTGSLLGAHAMTLAIIALIADRWHLKLRMHPQWQQSFTLALALLLNAVLLFWIGGITGHMARPLDRFIPVVISALIWPWVYALLRRVRQHFIPA